VSFGSGSSVGRILQYGEFALDAQQFGHVPAFVAGFAAGERLLDGFEPSAISRLCRTNRQFAKQEQEAWQKSRLAGLFEPTAQRLQPALMSPRLAVTKPLKQRAQTCHRRIGWRSVCSTSIAP